MLSSPPMPSVATTTIRVALVGLLPGLPGCSSSSMAPPDPAPIIAEHAEAPAAPAGFPTPAAALGSSLSTLQSILERRIVLSSALFEDPAGFSRSDAEGLVATWYDERLEVSRIRRLLADGEVSLPEVCAGYASVIEPIDDRWLLVSASLREDPRLGPELTERLYGGLQARADPGGELSLPRFLSRRATLAFWADHPEARSATPATLVDLYQLCEHSETG